MGCDIHLFVEQKVDGRWELVSVPKGWDLAMEKWMVECPNTSLSPEWYPWRNYDLFARLADVRNRENIQPLDEPRGLPLDVSIGVRQEWDNSSDVHSASWFNAAELRGQDWDDNLFRKIIDHMRTLGSPSDVRIVFWFDN